MKRMMLALSTALVALSGCAGDSSGIASISTPPVTVPTPAPTPTPTQVTAPLGVVADTQFATAGTTDQIRWNNATQTYELQMSGAAWETLKYGGTSHFVPSGPSLSFYSSDGCHDLEVRNQLTYKYTTQATLFDDWGDLLEQFAFGIGTVAANVPKTGRATYGADLFGHSNDAPSLIGGTAALNFDFAAGTLSGHLDPVWKDWTDAARPDIVLGRYDFINTVYSTGSASFSGQLSNSSVSGSGSFQGSFTGPAAEELMGHFDAPFLDPFSHKQVNMTGVIIGKRP